MKSVHIYQRAGTIFLPSYHANTTSQNTHSGTYKLQNTNRLVVIWSQAGLLCGRANACCVKVWQKVVWQRGGIFSDVALCKNELCEIALVSATACCEKLCQRNSKLYYVLLAKKISRYWSIVWQCNGELCENKRHGSVCSSFRGTVSLNLRGCVSATACCTCTKLW